MRIAVLFVALGLSCAPATNWTDLHSIEDLKEVFNRDDGHVRLVVLLSPT